MFSMWILASLFLSFFASTVDRSDRPDRILLKDGKEIVCRVMFEDETRVLYKTQQKVLEIARSKVQEVQSLERRSREFLDRFTALNRKSAAELAGLALWAEDNDLPDEAHGLWLRVIMQDAKDEEAWNKLGGRHTKAGWTLRVGSQTFDVDELRKAGRDWKHALQISTAHFQIKTNADLSKALDVAIDLERIYVLYYERIGQQIELYPFEWKPEIRIHGGGKRAPQPPVAGVDSWYDPKSNVIMVYGDHARPNHLRRAAMDMMIHNSFRMALGNRDGTLPVWAHEGLANEFVLALRSVRGELKVKPGVPYQPWFDAQARGESELTIRRVFSSSSSDYGGGSNRLGFQAGSYTLVFFLLNEQDGKYREPFFDYLRQAFRGKGSISRFSKAFPVDLKVVTGEWNEFVHKTAGF